MFFTEVERGLSGLTKFERYAVFENILLHAGVNDLLRQPNKVREFLRASSQFKRFSETYSSLISMNRSISRERNQQLAEYKALPTLQQRLKFKRKHNTIPNTTMLGGMMLLDERFCTGVYYIAKFYVHCVYNNARTITMRHAIFQQLRFRGTFNTSQIGDTKLRAQLTEANEALTNPAISFRISNELYIREFPNLFKNYVHHIQSQLQPFESRHRKLSQIRTLCSAYRLDRMGIGFFKKKTPSGISKLRALFNRIPQGLPENAETLKTNTERLYPEVVKLLNDKKGFFNFSGIFRDSAVAGTYREMHAILNT